MCDFYVAKGLGARQARLLTANPSTLILGSLLFLSALL